MIIQLPYVKFSTVSKENKIVGRFARQYQSNVPFPQGRINIPIDDPQLKFGESIFALGFPASMGGILVRSQAWVAGIDPKQNIIVSGSFNSGNSGGPLFNAEGTLVGVVVAKASAFNTVKGDLIKKVTMMGGIMSFSNGNESASIGDFHSLLENLTEQEQINISNARQTQKIDDHK